MLKINKINFLDNIHNFIYYVYKNKISKTNIQQANKWQNINNIETNNFI